MTERVLSLTLSLRFITLLILSSQCSQNRDSNSNTAQGKECIFFTGARIIDVNRKEIIEGKAIKIVGKRIVDIVDESDVDSQRDSVVNASGTWVMPGLIDTHAHATVLEYDTKSFRMRDQYDKDASINGLKNFVAFGITTIKNPAAPTMAGIELRNLVELDSILGPKIYTSGYALNRTKAVFGPFAPTPKIQDIENEISRQNELGVDFIKVYSSLSPDLIKAAIDKAHELDLKVVGHLQNTSWTDGSNLGIDFITHAAPWHETYIKTNRDSLNLPNFISRLVWLENVDYESDEILEMLDAIRDNGVVVDPTLIAFKTKFWGDDDLLTKGSHLSLAPKSYLRLWNKVTFTSSWREEDYRRAKLCWPKLLELSRIMFESGIMMTTGSDYPNPWVAPGFSLHQEMEILVEAGIPIWEVLKMATINGAISVGDSINIGSIEKDKEADLVFLTENPIEDITNTRKIKWTVLDGRIYEFQKMVQQ